MRFPFGATGSAMGQDQNSLGLGINDTAHRIVPLWLMARGPPSQKVPHASEIEVMQALMKDTIEEVSARRKAQLDSPLGAVASGSGSESEGSSEVQGSGGRERVPDLRLGLASGYLRRDQDQEPLEQGGPTNSQWGRRQLGDDWYEARCIRCCRCHRDVCASVRDKRGVRCSACLRWFHDTCAPPGTLPDSKAKRECDAFTSEYLHCPGCAELQQRLRAGAAALCSQVLPGDCTLTLVDCHRLRQQIKPGHAHTERAQDTTSTTTRPSSQPRSAVPFQRVAKDQLRVMKRLGTAGLEPGTGPLATSLAAATTADTPASPSPTLSQPTGGLADLRAVVRIFGQGGEALEEVLEDSWAVVLRCRGTPVSAASLLVLGDDHAKLQTLVTVPEAMRRGHARLLMHEVQGWLSKAGVPRMVVVLPEQQAARGTEDDGGERALKRLGFSTLGDLERLGHWKEMFYPYYTRDLIGRRPRVMELLTARKR